MYLFVSGEFNKEEVLEVLKDNEEIISNKDKNIVEIKKEVEPYDVNIKYQEMSLKGLTMPKMLYSFKISLAGYKLRDKYIYKRIMTIILLKVFGPSSTFFVEGLNTKKFTNFDYSAEIVDDFLIVELACESDKPKDVIPLIKEYYDKTKIEPIDIERFIKGTTVSVINKFDDTEGVVDSLRDDLLTYNEIIYDKLEMIKDISLKEVNKIKDNIDFDNVSIIVASPK